MQTFHTVKYSKIAQKGKSCLKLFELKNVSRNEEISSKVIEYNRDMFSRVTVLRWCGGGETTPLFENRDFKFIYLPN
jgi:hypothetical protein